MYLPRLDTTPCGSGLHDRIGWIESPCHLKLNVLEGALSLRMRGGCEDADERDRMISFALPSLSGSNESGLSPECQRTNEGGRD